MTLPPILSDTARCEALDDRPAKLRKCAMLDFARWATPEPDALPELSNPDTAAQWREGLAAELLFRQKINDGDFDDKRLFTGSEITVGELKKIPSAVCLLPLDTGDLAQLWVFQCDTDSPLSFKSESPLEGTEAWEAANPGCRIACRTTLPNHGGTVGSSWQLAAELAKLALNDPTLRDQLARDWIVTGQIQQNEVKRVGFGGKASLETANGRSWLIPPLNKGDLSPNFTEQNRGKIFYPLTPELAWRTIGKIGTLKEPESDEWPPADEFDSFHALISDAIGPVIASILFTRIDKIFLWHSASTTPSAEKVKETLEILNQKVPGLLPDSFSCELREMSSSDIQEGEESLMMENIHLLDEKIILFNITGGNALMKYAVMGLGNFNPNLWSIYRDFDDHKRGVFHEFVRIRTQGARTYTGKLVGDISGLIGQWIDLKILNDRTEAEEPAEDYVQRFIKKVP